MDLWYCFVHSPIVGHLDHFHFLMIINSAAGNLCVEVCFSFFLTSYSRRELLGYMAALYLTFWGTAKLLSRAHVHFHILTIHSPTLVVVFLIIANLVDMKRYLIVLFPFISISLVNNLQHLFMFLLATHITALERYILLNPLSTFKLSYFSFYWVFFMYLEYNSLQYDFKIFSSLWKLS